MDNSKPTAVVLVIDAVGKKTLENLMTYTGRIVNLSNLSKFSFETSVMQASAHPDSIVGHREMVGVVNPIHYDLRGLALRRARHQSQVTGLP